MDLTWDEPSADLVEAYSDALVSAVDTVDDFRPFAVDKDFVAVDSDSSDIFLVEAVFVPSFAGVDEHCPLVVPPAVAVVLVDDYLLFEHRLVVDF